MIKPDVIAEFLRGRSPFREEKSPFWEEIIVGAAFSWLLLAAGHELVAAGPIATTLIGTIQLFQKNV